MTALKNSPQKSRVSLWQNHFDTDVILDCVKGFKKVEKTRQKDYNRNVMKNTTTDIYQVNDSFFHKIFDNPENARDFLERVLPAGTN